LNNLQHLLTNTRWFSRHLSSKYRNIATNQTLKLPISFTMMRLPLFVEIALVCGLCTAVLLALVAVTSAYPILASMFTTGGEIINYGTFNTETKPFYSICVPLIVLVCLGGYFFSHKHISLKRNGIVAADIKQNSHVLLSSGQIQLPPFSHRFKQGALQVTSIQAANPISMTHQQVVNIEVSFYTFFGGVGEGINKYQIQSFQIELTNGENYLLDSWALPLSSLLYLFIYFDYPVSLKDISA
jgi:hypothetical protein